MKINCPHCNKEFEVDQLEMAKAFATIGGKKSASLLTRDQRVEKAKKAIATRWNKDKT